MKADRIDYDALMADLGFSNSDYILVYPEDKNAKKFGNFKFFEEENGFENNTNK